MKNLLKTLNEIDFVEGAGYIVLFFLLFSSLIMFLGRV